MARTTPTTRVNKWDEELAKEAAAQAAELPAVSAGAFLSTAGGRLKFQGADVPGNKLDVIVLGFVSENQFYEGRYDPANSSSPICYAFGHDQKEMRPHDASPDAQHTDCASCPHNQWGSDPNGGKGKACKNVMRLAMVPAGDPDADVFFAKVPVTSVKNFSKYANDIAAQLKRPVFSVVTRLATEPDDTSQFKMLFQLVEQIEDGNTIGSIMERRKTLDLTFPYPERTAQPTAKSPTPAGRAPFRGSRKL